MPSFKRNAPRSEKHIRMSSTTTRWSWARGQLDGTGRERGGYPLGFHAWTLERRNAWWAGASQGGEDCDRHDREAADASAS